MVGLTTPPSKTEVDEALNSMVVEMIEATCNSQRVCFDGLVYPTYEDAY